MIQVDPRYIGNPKRIKQVKKWIGSLEIMARHKEDEYQHSVISNRIAYWNAYLAIIKPASKS